MNSLNFASFTHKQSLRMGLEALQIVADRHYRRIGIRITLDQKLVFQYLMDGKNEDVYLRGKEKVVQSTGLCSQEVELNKELYPLLASDPECCVSGGALPIIIGGECRGSISISGMTPKADHLLALEVLTHAYEQA